MRPRRVGGNALRRCRGSEKVEQVPTNLTSCRSGPS